MEGLSIITIKNETLLHVLSKMLCSSIISADYETKELQGGTVGDVYLVTGIAKTSDQKEVAFKIVWKIQEKWERPGDPDSWRREYDLYASDFNKSFTESFRMPECYYAEITDDENQIWMEYIDGVSSSSLTIDMLEEVAYQLGCFQGKYSSQSSDYRNVSCFNDVGFLEREFSQWHKQTFSYDFLISEPCRMPVFLKQMLKDGDIQLVDGKSFEYGFLRSRGCKIPEHLKQMLIEIDNDKESIIEKFNTLPIVLCHRDFWNENIFFSEDSISLIDWDTSGWGFLGEDIASLIVDGMEVQRFEENYRRLIPAYLKGLSEYMDVSSIDDLYILDMILIKFGYRMAQEYMFSESKDKEFWGIQALQKIYEMKKKS